MKNFKINILTNLGGILAVLFFTTMPLAAMAQVPTNVPSPEAEPVDFLGSTANIILYVVIPIVIIVLIIIWRRRINKRNPDKDQ
jgi:preprotein translocase subunit SecG